MKKFIEQVLFLVLFVFVVFFVFLVDDQHRFWNSVGIALDITEKLFSLK